VNAGFVYRDEIGPRDAELTVLDHLARRYPHSSAAVWSERIERGEVLLDGRPAALTDRLSCGLELAWHRPPWEEPPVPLAFAILYRDDNVLAVAKPRGLPSVPAGGFLEHTLLHLVKARFPDATPLHQCVLAHASDMTLLDTSLLPHGLTLYAGTLQVASLDHAMWFHRPFRADEWLLYVQESTSASGARGFNLGRIYRRDGVLIASVAQEGLIRVRQTAVPTKE